MIFPPIPPWNGLHVLIIHFPIALLMVVPVFLAMGFLARKNGRIYAICALILLALGSVSSIVAVETGHAAAQAATKTPEVRPVIHDHAEHGEDTRDAFIALTVIYAALLFLPWTRRMEHLGRFMMTAQVVFFVVYLVALLLVIQTGYLGGMLVHKYGLHANL